MNFTIEVSPEGFRKARASQDCPAGFLLNTETPTIFALFDTRYESFCAQCLTPFDRGEDKPDKPALKKNRCTGGCASTFYCSRACQKAAHPIHKHTCKNYEPILDQAANPRDDFPLDQFMLLRNAFIHCCNVATPRIGVNSKTIPPLPKFLEDLHYSEPLSPPHYADHDAGLAMATAYSVMMDSPEAATWFHVLMSKFRCNNYCILTPRHSTVAHAVFSNSSVFNHSCHPNCCVTYNDAVQTIRTIKPVAKGEELFHAYCDITWPISMRRDHLEEIYGFKCACDRCSGLTSVDESELTRQERPMTELQMVEIETSLKAAAAGGDAVESTQRE